MMVKFEIPIILEYGFESQVNCSVTSACVQQEHTTVSSGFDLSGYPR